MFHKRLLKEFKENKKAVVGMVTTQWVMLIANVILMLQAAGFIELFAEKPVKTSAVYQKSLGVLVTLILVIAVRSIMSSINSRLSFQASNIVKSKLRTMIYEKLMRLGNQYKKSFQTSEVVQLSTEGVEQLEIYFGKYVPQFFYSMLAPVTLFVIIAGMSLKVAVVLLVCVPLIPVSIVAVQKFAKKMLAKYWGTYTQMGDSFLECLQGLTTLKIYQADERYAKKMDEEAELFRKVTMRVLIMQLNSISIMDLIAYGGAAVGGILSILEYQSNQITLAQCFFILMISAEFFLPLRQLGSFFHIAMNGNAAADKIFRLLDTPENQEIDLEASKDGIGKLENDFEISVNHISFSYEKEKEILTDLNFTAKCGLTALVGESGCGKSTITSLIMKENKENSGTITIGNMRLDKITELELHRMITRIKHDSYLFAGSIRDNLLMAKPDATDSEIYEALKRVQLLDFVNENGGIDYILKEKASNISGGQKQRLALARVLLHDTPVYIFDEATSNVDVESENAIMEVVRELSKHKTVLLISHRLANVVTADQIYMMSNGQIVEHGTHQELVSFDGAYKKLYQTQKQLETIGKEAL